LLQGLHFVWHRKTVLGAISLGLFAVLFGGATALLPAYTRDGFDPPVLGGEWARVFFPGLLRMQTFEH
jgi:hypothetical protein